MVQAGRHEKFLEVLTWLPHLALEVMFGSHNILLVRVIRFLAIIIAAGSNRNPLGASLLPLFAVFDAFLSAFTSSFG
jgi:hypothetical protein